MKAFSMTKYVGTETGFIGDSYDKYLRPGGEKPARNAHAIALAQVQVQVQVQVHAHAHAIALSG